MLASSGDMNDLLPVDIAHTYQGTETSLSTSFVPQTRTYTANGSDATDAYLITRGDSPQSTLIFDEKLQTFEVILTTTTTQAADNTEKLIAVGITCGVMGIVLGIVISVVFWSHKKRKSKKNEPRIAMEKNPKEKTFEPLDLSLTLPSYEPNVNSTRRQHSSLGFHHGDSNRQGHRQYRYKDMHHSFKLPSTSPSSPVIHNCGSSNGNSHPQKTTHPSSHDSRYHKSKSWDKTASLDNRVLRHTTTSHGFGSRDLESAKLPPSISTRESFSSGLGTCTESEVCSFESRSQPTPNESELKAKTTIHMKSETLGSNTKFSDNLRNKMNFSQSKGEKPDARIKHLETDEVVQSLSDSNQSLASSQSSINDSASSVASTSPTSTLAYDEKVLRPIPFHSKHNPTSDSIFKNRQNKDGKSFFEVPNEERCESPTPSSDSSELNERTSTHEITIIRRNSDVTIDL